MRPRISIRGFVRPSVGPSVRPSVRPSVGLSVRPSVRRSVCNAYVKIAKSIGKWFFLHQPWVFRCGYRISIRGFVRPSVGRSVRRSVGRSVRNAFVKIAKSIGKWLFFAYLCTYIACPTIYWSVCPLFWLSVHHSVHPYVCSHIVKIAKSIAKSSKSIWSQWNNSTSTSTSYCYKRKARACWHSFYFITHLHSVN